MSQDRTVIAEEYAKAKSEVKRLERLKTEIENQINSEQRLIRSHEQTMAQWVGPGKPRKVFQVAGQSFLIEHGKGVLEVENMVQ